MLKEFVALALLSTIGSHFQQQESQKQAPALLSENDLQDVLLHVKEFSEICPTPILNGARLHSVQHYKSKKDKKAPHACQVRVEKGGLMYNLLFPGNASMHILTAEPDMLYVKFYPYKKDQWKRSCFSRHKKLRGRIVNIEQYNSPDAKLANLFCKLSYASWDVFQRWHNFTKIISNTIYGPQTVCNNKGTHCVRV